jgi:hypothetical protein
MRFGLTSLVLIFVAACSSKSTSGDGTCKNNSDCNAGEICAATTCVRLCRNDADCGAGSVCSEQTCQPGERQTPVIFDIAGDGSSSCAAATNNACITAGLTVVGKNLLGASFSLEPSAGGAVTALVPRGALTDETAALDLPLTVTTGTYTLTATNAAGSADQAVELLKGEPGPTGPTGPQGPTGALDQIQVDAMNAAIAAASPTKVSLTDAATITVDASLGTMFEVTLAGNRQLSNPTGLKAGGLYTFLVHQDGVGGRLVSWGTAYRRPPEVVDLGTFVPRNVGVVIGNLNGGAAIGNVFDGNINQSDSSGGAYNSGSGPGYVGKNWPTPKRIKRVRAYGFTDYGFQNPANGPCRLSIRGSNDGSAWITLYTSSTIWDREGIVVDITVGMGLNADNAYTYHSLLVESLGSDGSDRVAELEFYEDPGLLAGATTLYSFASDGTSLFQISRSSGL